MEVYATKAFPFLKKQYKKGQAISCTDAQGVSLIRHGLATKEMESKPAKDTIDVLVRDYSTCEDKTTFTVDELKLIASHYGIKYGSKISEGTLIKRIDEATEQPENRITK